MDRLLSTKQISAIGKPTAEDLDAWRNFLSVGYHTDVMPEYAEDCIYAKAWADGCSHGYDEVERHYGELAELCRKVIRSV